MKTSILTATVLVIGLAGCSSGGRNRTTDEPATHSDGGYTWKVGATTVNGTNAGADQMQIQSIHATNTVSGNR